MTPTEREMLFCQYCILYMQLPTYIQRVENSIELEILDGDSSAVQRINKMAEHIKRRTRELLEEMENES